MSRGVALLRQGDCAVEVLAGVSEEKLIAHIQQGLADPTRQPMQLVLVPWYLYATWSKLEGFFGLTRSHGPTVAGYYGESVAAKDFPKSRDLGRATFIDLANLDPMDWARVVRAAGFDSLRSGCLGLLAAGSAVYADPWLNGTALGARIDSLNQLADATDWQKRLPAARQILSALWGLIFEEGTGKADFHQPPKTLKATFQTGMDARAWVFRLCFPSQHFGPAEVLSRFWPNEAEATALSQLLLQSSDLLRVHWMADSGSVEITAVLFASAPSVSRPKDARTLWLEPLQSAQMMENPFDKPGSPQAPHLKALPVANAAPAAVKPVAMDEKQARLMADTSAKLRDLTQMVRERDEVIRELRSGGVGTAPPLPPPDTDGLLEAFQFRFFEADNELRRLEQQVAEIERTGSDPLRIAALKRRIAELTEKEKGWIRTIAQTIDLYRQKRSAGG